MAKETPKLSPAPLPNNGQGGFLSMGTGNQTLAKKHSAEVAALEAKHAAEKAQLEHKHEQERSKSGPQPIPSPKKITQKVRQIDMSKFD
jgi:hypothetical protein